MKSCQILLLLLSCFFISCNNNKKEAAPIVPEVSVVEVGQKNVPVYTEYVGQAFGKSDVEIIPRVQGWVQALQFKEGSAVKKGQLLYVIQDDELRDREQSSVAQLSEANVMLVKAKSDLDRVRPLTEMNALSKRDLDAAQATYDAQKQSVAAAQAGLNNARTQLSYTRITAPISGVIGISKVQVGDYVRSVGQSSINTVSAVGEMRVRFPITESDYLMFQQRANKSNLRTLPVEFVLNDGSVFNEKGTLDLVNREIDPGTGSLLVQAIVPNTSHLLRPGQYVKVRLKTDELSNAVLVPQQAINQMQNVYMAFVVNDSSKINPKPVKTGLRVGSNWVITEGLKPGDKVALVGNALIKPNMLIKPVMRTYSYDSTLTGK